MSRLAKQPLEAYFTTRHSTTPQIREDSGREKRKNANGTYANLDVILDNHKKTLQDLEERNTSHSKNITLRHHFRQEALHVYKLCMITVL